MLLASLFFFQGCLFEKEEPEGTGSDPAADRIWASAELDSLPGKPGWFLATQDTSVRFLGRASEGHARIVKWEWSVDEGRTFADVSPDSGYTGTLPSDRSTAMGILRGTGKSGRVEMDTAFVTRPYEINLAGHQAEWKVGAGSWSMDGDTWTFNACEFQGAACNDWKGGFIWTEKVSARAFRISGSMAFNSKPGRIPFPTETTWLGYIFHFQDTANFLAFSVGPHSTEFFRLQDGKYSRLADWAGGYYTAGLIGSVPELTVEEDSIHFVFPYQTQKRSAPMPADSKGGYVGFVAQHDWAGFGSLRVAPFD